MTVPTEGTDPTVPVPESPQPTPEEAAAQQAAADKAAAEAALNDQIRALAAEIAKQTILAYDPVTRRKGTVSSLQTTSAPPTITVQISGDTTVEIPGVRYYEHYSPAVNDVVHIDKVGTDLVAIGKIAEQYSETTWATPSLASGFSHNGNTNGNLQYRRVWDHGAWRMIWKGSVARSSGSTIISAGVLDVKYRPAEKRTLIVARQINGAVGVQIDFNTDGSVVMFGGTAAPASTDLGTSGSTAPDENAHSHTGTTSVASPGDSTHNHGNHEHVIPASNAGLSEHNHSGAVSTVGHSHPNHSHSGTTNVTTPNDSTHNHGNHEHGIDTVFHTHGSHNHDMGSHDHDVAEPTWISFNGGIEYWL